MSLPTMYWLAATARDKLQCEADKDDHNLRLLVGHANLLDKVLPELEADETAIKLHLVQSEDEPGVPESPHKMRTGTSHQKQRISVILNEVDWSEYEDDDTSGEACNASEDEDDECIADGLPSSRGSERADFGVPLYRTKKQTVVCVAQTFSEFQNDNSIEGSLRHDSDLVRLESTLDVLKIAEAIEEIHL